MSRRSLSPSERRTIALAALVLGVPLLYLKVVRPYRESVSTVGAQLVVARQALATERATVLASAQNPFLQQAVDSAMAAMGPRLFSGRDETAAAAELSNYVKSLARGNHVLVQSSGTRPPVVSSSGLRTLRVEVRAESDLRGILSFLNALERGDRLVRIERMEIAHPAGVEESSDVETLTFSAVVNGYAVGEPPPPPQTPGRGGAPARRGGVGGAQ